MSRYGQGRGGRPWRRLVEIVKIRDQYTCYVCGRITDEGDCDHKVPLSKGGTNDLGNLGWICRVPCHRDKTITDNGSSVKAAIGEDGWPK